MSMPAKEMKDELKPVQEAFDRNSKASIPTEDDKELHHRYLNMQQAMVIKRERERREAMVRYDEIVKIVREEIRKHEEEKHGVKP